MTNMMQEMRPFVHMMFLTWWLSIKVIVSEVGGIILGVINFRSTGDHSISKCYLEYFLSLLLVILVNFLWLLKTGHCLLLSSILWEHVCHHCAHLATGTDIPIMLSVCKGQQ